MFKIPFHLMPGSWGLKGKTRAIAQAEYELTGYELKKRLLELKIDEMDTKTHSMDLLELEYEYGRITKDEYNRYTANLIEDETTRNLAIAELDFKDGKMTELEFAKKSATLKGEPWVNIVNMDFTQKSSLEGSFELDWNQHFVDKLKAEGYTGPTPDNIVNQWFMELCRNIAMEEFDGTGNFASDSEANLDAVKRWSTESFPEGRKGYK